MKQFLTLRNVIKFSGVLLAFVGFFFMFGNQLVWSNTEVKFNEALFGDNGAILSFVGYILIILGSLIPVVAVFAKGGEKLKKYMTLAAAVILIVGAIFVFVEAAIYNANASKYIATHYSLTAFPILAGIFAIVGGLAIAASEFVADKPLVK